VLDHAADVQGRHPVTDAEHEVGVVLDEENADAAIAQRPDDVAEVLDLVAGQSAGRLVEQDEARPHRQAARDLEEALLGMREQVGAPPEDVAEADAVQQLDRAGAQRPVLAADPRQAEGGGEEARARMGPRTEHGVVEHRQRRQQARLLEGAGDAEARAVLHGRGRQVFAVEPDPAAVRLVVAGEEVEQRRLAAAVRADQAVHFAGAQLQRDALERMDAAEVLADVLRLERRHGPPGRGRDRLCDRRADRQRHRAAHGATSMARASRGRSGSIGSLLTTRGRTRSITTSTIRPIPSGTASTTTSKSSP